MSDPQMTMEVPPQVRDFAVKSVDQAEKSNFVIYGIGKQIRRYGPESDERRGTTGTCDHREEPEGSL